MKWTLILALTVDIKIAKAIVHLQLQLLFLLMAKVFGSPPPIVGTTVIQPERDIRLGERNFDGTSYEWRFWL